MKNDSNVTLSRLIDEVQICISNASEQPEIQKKMSQNGFNQRRILEGIGLLDNCKALHTEQSNKYSEKKALTSQIRAHTKLARETFEDHVAIVKFVYRKSPEKIEKFKIDRIDKNIKSWTLQANYFYTKVSEHQAEFEPHGLTLEDVTQALAMIEAVSSTRNLRMLRKGEAEEATRSRNASMKALRAWLKDFRAIARMSLRESPQLMEALGMVVKA